MQTDSSGAHEALMAFLYRAPIGLVQATLDGTIEMINPMTASLLMPLSPDGNLVNLFDALEVAAPHLREMAASYQPASGTICESVRVPLPPGAGRDHVTQVLSISLLKLDESLLMAMVSDATLEVQREEAGLARRLDAAARTDGLTLMPNRLVVRDVIQRAIELRRAGAGYEFAIFFMNCDRLKQINDSFGHATGDEVLGLIAERLRSTLRQRDRGARKPAGESMAARLGSDEFVVFLDDLQSADEALAVAQRLLDVFSRTFKLSTHELHLTASMGVIFRSHVSGDADAVLQDASIAMVEAKRAGGARYVVFEPAMHERASRRGDIESQLHHALIEQQLFVVYQPVVAWPAADDRDRLPGHAAGVEALVRWRHPTRGVVPPVEFIGVAEECGLIGTLGEFVLSTACCQFVQWQRDLGALAPRLLAVNLSRGQLRDPGLAGVVARILHSSGMRAAQLQLEVTESMAVQGMAMRECLKELKELGVSLALDDFGTGYSSLSSLHELPVDTVKIDRSFVSEALSSAHHRVLIEATVRVATSLGMGTVAEGIETQDQAALVQQLGCGKGQGYYFSKPLAAGDLVHWLTSTEATRRASRCATAPQPR